MVCEVVEHRDASGHTHRLEPALDAGESAQSRSQNVCSKTNVRADRNGG